MGIDEMDEQPPRRRWEDVQREIEFRIPPALAQAMTPYRLAVDEVHRDVQGLKLVVYGNPAQGVHGMVERMGAIEKKLDTVIDQNEARLNQWKGIKAAIVVVGAISSVPALQTIAKVFGLIP